MRAIAKGRSVWETRARIAGREPIMMGGDDDSMETRPSLLLRLRDDSDTEAWVLFVGTYAPLIHRFARRGGLQDADAADLTQEVLVQVARSIGSFEYNAE